MNGYGTTSVDISIETDINATCRYASTPNVAYGNMTGSFSITGATHHSTTVSGLTDGSVNRQYVLCKDSVNQDINREDYLVTFTVSASPDQAVYQHPHPYLDDIDHDRLAMTEVSTTPDISAHKYPRIMLSEGQYLGTAPGETSKDFYTKYHAIQRQVGSIGSVFLVQPLQYAFVAALLAYP